MSIMVGVTTNKFLMIAAALYLPVRIDRERVEAVIDDAVPVSVISPQLAGKLHIPESGSLRRPIHVSIGAAEFSVASLQVSDAPFTDDAHRGKDVILGDDVLRTAVLDLDFVQKTIRLVLPGERAQHIRGFAPVTVTSDADGRFTVDLARYAQSRIILDLPHRTIWVAQ